MGVWDAIAAALSGGVNTAAYGTQSGRMFRPVVNTKETDDTLITVPVIDLASLQQQRNLSHTSSLDPAAEADAKNDKSKIHSLSGFWRKSPNANYSPRDTKVHVTVRQVTRREYFKHYAKDNHGGFVGSESPAEDCILNEEDSAKWRGAARLHLSIPLSGVGMESLKGSGDVKPKSTPISNTASMVAATKFTAGENGTRNQPKLFKGFKGGDGDTSVFR